MDVELQLLALEIARPQTDGHKSIPRNEEVFPFAEIKSIEHVADASVLIEQHVLLHAAVLGAEELVL